MPTKFDPSSKLVSGKTTSAIVIVLSVALVGGAIATTTMSGSADARVQVNDFSIDDASLESSDGVGSINMILNPTVEWANLPAPVESVSVEVYVSGPDGDAEQAFTWTTTGDLPEEQQEWGDTEGWVVFDLGVDVLEETSWSQEDFAPPAGGETTESFDVQIVNEVAWDGGSATEEASTTASVTVTDPTEETATPEEDEGTNDSEESEQADPEVSVSGSGYLEVDAPA